jgi:UDP-N-acetylmuramoyl-tripeptide--D-alanyl-D-alanine ligase
MNDRILYRNKETIDGEIINKTTPFLTFNFIENGEIIQSITTQLIGDYNLNNVLASMAIGMYFEVGIQDIFHAIESYSPSNNRSQWLETENNQLILDAYNANPSSTALALNNFIKLQIDNKLVILGDMLELGDTAKEEHQAIIEILKNDDIEVLLVGSIYSSCTIHDNMQAFATTKECEFHMHNSLIKGKTILIKGSRGLQLESLTKYL